jgi:heptosyltransferase II
LLRTAALGDFLFAVPAMVQLRKQYPNAKIFLLTATTTNSAHKAAVESYAGTASLPWLSFMMPTVINEAICVSSFDLKTLRTKIRNKVSEMRPDATVILAHPGEAGMSLFKKIVFLRLLDMRVPIFGWRVRASNRWFRKAQYQAGRFEHHILGPLRSIAELPGMPPVEEMEITFPLNLEPTARPWSEDLWRGRGWLGARIVAVAPGSMHSHKHWPIEHFIALCQGLVGHYQVSIVVIGTELDKSLGERLVEAVGGDVVNLAGETTLSQSAALLERCTLLVGNDGGAMHLGSAMGCPVVSIVPGIEYPDSIEPFFSRDLAVRHPVSCAPCYNFTHCPLKHNECMVELPVSDVFERCARVLHRDIISEAIS